SNQESYLSCQHMNKNKAAKPSLRKLLEQLIFLDTVDLSVEQFHDAIKSFESNIENLEARVQSLQDEVAILIAEQ
ncbi:MAG: hypothetical protein AAFR62_19690, partial [Cyanobacteria bacterium J06629_2]